jgi:hypothetical protein
MIDFAVLPPKPPTSSTLRIGVTMYYWSQCVLVPCKMNGAAVQRQCDLDSNDAQDRPKPA